jgi:translation initiation factor IF-2
MPIAPPPGSRLVSAAPAPGTPGYIPANSRPGAPRPGTYGPRPGGYGPRSGGYGPRPPGAGGGYGGAPGGPGGPGAGSNDPRRKKIFVARKPTGPGGRPGQPPPPLPAGGRHYDKKKHASDSKGRDKDEVETFENKILRKEAQEQNEFANIPAGIEISEVISIKNLAMKLNLKASQIIKKFMSLGVMDLTVNDNIDHESASILCHELGCEIKVVSLLEQTKVEEDKGAPEDYVTRDPIVTVMGHVDHGKTSLLDAIRSTSVAAGESGGITQHIGAYKVKTEKGAVLFIDTPGHAAFSNMRARGAQVTDVVILVVSGVDGVMPQTIEAAAHAKAAGVPVVVAVNKMDLPGAETTRIKNQLSEKGLVSEEWGGDTMFVEVSATKKTGLTKLLESVLLTAELRQLKANPRVRASGYVIESKIEQGRGNVATVIVKNGTLKPGAAYLCGNATGRVRAMYDDLGKEVKVAGPSTPVEIIGLSVLPQAGMPFTEMENEKEARRVAERREELARENAAQNVKKVNLGNLFDTLKQRAVKEQKVLVKADVFGSVEAIRDMLAKIQNEEVKISVIQAAAGAINETDVDLAATSNAMIIGFKVRPNGKAKKEAERLGVDIRIYQIIYEIVDDMTKALTGMLDEQKREERLGSLTIKEVFKISGVGKIAGCAVNDGKVVAKARARLMRDGVQIWDGDIASLKHYKDEVKEVLAGTDCGLQLKDFQDLKPGDTVESYQLVTLERKLEISQTAPEA